MSKFNWMLDTQIKLNFYNMISKFVTSTHKTEIIVTTILM